MGGTDVSEAVDLLLLGEEGVVLVEDEGAGSAFSVREGEAVEVERDRRVEVGRGAGHGDLREPCVDVGTPHDAHSVVLSTESWTSSCGREYQSLHHLVREGRKGTYEDFRNDLCRTQS